MELTHPNESILTCYRCNRSRFKRWPNLWRLVYMSWTVVLHHRWSNHSEWGLRQHLPTFLHRKVIGTKRDKKEISHFIVEALTLSAFLQVTLNNNRLWLFLPHFSYCYRTADYLRDSTHPQGDKGMLPFPMILLSLCIEREITHSLNC